MSKRYYIVIAREIAEILRDFEGNNAAITAIGLLASRLACVLKDDNARLIGLGSSQLVGWSDDDQHNSGATLRGNAA
jgi:hypothetical protein